MIFPTLMYKLEGPHRGPNGTTYAFVEARNEQEAEFLLASGWDYTLNQSMQKKLSSERSVVNVVRFEEPELSLPSRDDLERQASALGIKFDGRTSNGRLIRLIAEAGDIV